MCLVYKIVISMSNSNIEQSMILRPELRRQNHSVPFNKYESPRTKKLQ